MKGMAVTAQRFTSTAAVAVVAIGLLCAGCTSQAGTSAFASPVAPSATETGPSMLPASPVAPSATVPASVEPSTEPSMETPSGAPEIGPTMPEPPAASLAVEGGDPVVGELGSFTWQNSGSDAPWVPGVPMLVGHGERLTLSLAADVRIANWTVSRTPSSTVGSGVVGVSDGSGEPVEFAAPPRGSWSVHVGVWFADNLGSASYYWLITVD